MLQLPLPAHFARDRNKIIRAIDSKKDVDGMTADSPFITPVVKAVIDTLDSSKISQPKSVSTVVVGAKGFVGKKIVKLLRDKGSRVAVCDLDTKDLGARTSKADILISATGVAGLISADMVKRGAVVIDVGAPKGDVRTEEVKEKAGFISPVPGGVGPVTIVSLLENLVENVEKLSQRW